LKATTTNRLRRTTNIIIFNIIHLTRFTNSIIHWRTICDWSSWNFSQLRASEECGSPISVVWILGRIPVELHLQRTISWSYSPSKQQVSFGYVEDNRCGGWLSMNDGTIGNDSLPCEAWMVSIIWTLYLMSVYTGP